MAENIGNSPVNPLRVYPFGKFIIARTLLNIPFGSIRDFRHEQISNCRSSRDGDNSDNNCNRPVWVNNNKERPFFFRKSANFVFIAGRNVKAFCNLTFVNSRCDRPFWKARMTKLQNIVSFDNVPSIGLKNIFDNGNGYVSRHW